MRHTRLFYGWVVVAVAFVCLAIAYAVWNSFSIFFVAISEDFGWSRGSTALAFSIFTIVYGLCSPLTGAVVDRLGPRAVIPAGAIILATGLFLASRVTELWQLYLCYGVFAALGVNMVGTMVNFSVLANWFARRRGTAFGIAAAGIGVGTLLLAPGSQYIISISGWRAAYTALAIIVLSVVPAVTLIFHRHRPEDMGLLPDGGPTVLKKSASGRPAAQVKVVNREWAGRAWDVRSAIATRAFWFLFFGMLFGTLAHQSVMVHQVAYLKDRGFDPLLSASLVGLVGIFGSVGKVAWGWVSDHIGREGTYALGMAFVIAGVLTLGSVADATLVWQAYAYAILLGLGYGVNAPLCSATAADLFQGKRFGSIYGVLYVGSGGGSSIGPWASGLLYDLTGGYSLSLVMSVAAALLSAAGFWLAAPRKVRLVPGVAVRMQARLGVPSAGGTA